MRITSQHVTAALLLSLNELTQAEVAKNVGVNPRTLTRWKNDTEFASLLGKVQQGVVEAATSHQRAVSLEAAQVISELMRGSESDNTRLDAAQDILNRVLGKPAQAITGSDGGPLRFSLDIAKPDDDSD